MDADRLSVGDVTGKRGDLAGPVVRVEIIAPGVVGIEVEVAVGVSYILTHLDAAQGRQDFSRHEPGLSAPVQRRFARERNQAVRP